MSPARSRALTGWASREAVGLAPRLRRRRHETACGCSLGQAGQRRRGVRRLPGAPGRLGARGRAMHGSLSLQRRAAGCGTLKTPAWTSSVPSVARPSVFRTSFALSFVLLGLLLGASPAAAEVVGNAAGRYDTVVLRNLGQPHGCRGVHGRRRRRLHAAGIVAQQSRHLRRQQGQVRRRRRQRRRHRRRHRALRPRACALATLRVPQRRQQGGRERTAWTSAQRGSPGRGPSSRSATSTAMASTT